MKKFEEDETEIPEKIGKMEYQANPENIKKLQCLESSETSSLKIKTFMSDVNFKNKLSSLARLRQKEESKNNINGSQSETNNSIKDNLKNKDIIILNIQKKIDMKLI